MLQQTFEAMERNLEHNNDACIDCAKTVVEVVCRVVVDSFHTLQTPLKPVQETPSLSDWLTAAIRALKLGDVRDDRFKKLVSSHHKLADALNDLRNKAGPASHGKDPYLERLAEHHRRSAVLAADAIVAFLYQAYLDAQLDPISSREPWERFAEDNALIDARVGLAVDAETGDLCTLRFMLPGSKEVPITINIEVSRLLYQLDRDAYVEALNAARGAPAVEPVEEQGES
ncbi:TPA: abortive infection family protein [Pseudomonas aeruginosa]